MKSNLRIHVQARGIAGEPLDSPTILTSWPLRAPRPENQVLSRPWLWSIVRLRLRGPAVEEPAEWHRAVAPVWEVGETTTHGPALSRPRRGFESRWGHQLDRPFGIEGSGSCLRA